MVYMLHPYTFSLTSIKPAIHIIQTVCSYIFMTVITYIITHVFHTSLP